MAQVRDLPFEWLGDVTTLHLLEAHVSKAEADGVPASIVAHLRDTIHALATEIGEGDTIRWFSSGNESWQRKCGISGLAIVRNGTIHRALMLAMN